MYTYSTQLTTDGHRLMLDLPPKFPTGRQRVRVVATVEDALLPQAEIQPDLHQYNDNKIKATIKAARARRPSDDAPLSDDFFAWRDSLLGTGRTRAEIDAQIAEERNSWGED